MALQKLKKNLVQTSKVGEGMLSLSYWVQSFLQYLGLPDVRLQNFLTKLQIFTEFDVLIPVFPDQSEISIFLNKLINFPDLWQLGY